MVASLKHQHYSIMAPDVDIKHEAVDYLNSTCTCHPQVCDIIGHLEAIGHCLEILLQTNMG